MNLKQIRKDLHQIPELAFNEHKTQKYILEILNRYPGLEIYTFDFPGIVAVYKINNDDYKLFRADMDALPISENTGCDYRSTHKGKMHACGHDIHMTILIGLINKVINNALGQNLIFLFQPAEEGKGGAKRVLNTGILDKFKIKEVYALHVNGKFSLGTIATRPGIFFANTEEVDLKFYGKSSHVAFPENGKDALWASVLFYHEFRKRINTLDNNNKILCKFGKLNSGVARNVIADFSLLEGTLRAFNQADKKLLEKSLKSIAKDVAEKSNLDYKVKFSNEYVAVNNSEGLFLKLRTISKQLSYEFYRAKPVMTAEDFGYFTQKYKGLLFWLGAGNNYDLHSPQFLPDDSVIDYGVEIFYKLAKS